MKNAKNLGQLDDAKQREKEDGLYYVCNELFQVILVFFLQETPSQKVELFASE